MLGRTTKAFVSKRGLVEEALLESVARYARIAANAPGAVCRFVPRPDGSAAFPFVGEGCREVYGLEPHEIQEDRPGFDRSVADPAATSRRGGGRAGLPCVRGSRGAARALPVRSGGRAARSSGRDCSWT
jgi:hypothetical protein